MTICKPCCDRSCTILMNTQPAEEVRRLYPKFNRPRLSAHLDNVLVPSWNG